MMKFVVLLAFACLAQLSQAFVVPAGTARFSCSSSTSSSSNVRSGAGSTTARPAAPKKAKVAEVDKAEPIVARKPQVVSEIAEKAGLNKTQAEAALVAFMETIMDTVADGGKVNLQGFGTFEARGRKGRIGRNPRTGDAIDIKATTVPAFSASKPFKDQVKAKHVD